MFIIIFIIGFIALAIFFTLGDDIKKYFEDKSIHKASILAVERMARIKVLSDNAKDIEKFIEANVKLLSEKSINSLINRLEIVRADKVITEDRIKRELDDLKDYDFGEAIPNDKASK